ncbi:MAG: hypothetical protein O7F74_05075 [Bacteroidetes bacterium]|nr:hypothetical protein [Bacteroidota bacterium]
MDLAKFMEDYANQVDGQFSEYDANKSVIIVPLPDQRFQSVVGEIKYAKKYDRKWIQFSSKICEYRDDIDLKDLIEDNSDFSYAKLGITQDYLQIEAFIFVEHATDDILKELIMEVATTADKWEFKLTGLDIN